MVIPPENLESGTDYTITLTASNSGGSRSYDFEFSTAEAFSGSLSINPSNSITAMVTELTLTLNGVETRVGKMDTQDVYDFKMDYITIIYYYILDYNGYEEWMSILKWISIIISIDNYYRIDNPL